VNWAWCSRLRVGVGWATYGMELSMDCWMMDDTCRSSRLHTGPEPCQLKAARPLHPRFVNPCGLAQW